MPNKSVESAAVHGSGGRARRRWSFESTSSRGVESEGHECHKSGGTVSFFGVVTSALSRWSLRSALLLVPAGANAASPVLEFVVPGDSLPVSFTTESGAVNAEMAGFKSLVHCTASHGEGELTGPRTTVSEISASRDVVTERGSQQ